MDTFDGTTMRTLPDGTRMFEGMVDMDPREMLAEMFGDDSDSRSESLAPSSSRSSSGSRDSVYLRGPYNPIRRGQTN